MRVSIRELAKAILPRSAEPKVLALLKAYIDESYDPQRIIIAGLIGTDEEWGRVGERWAATLQSHGAPYFHSSKVAAQRNAFADWSRERCAALRAACADVIAESSLGEIVSGFIGDWAEVVRQCPGIEKRFPTPYAFCFELAVAQMQRSAVRWYKGDKVACIFDAQDQHSRRAVEVWQANQDNGLWSNISSVAYANDRDVIELQCADMVAHENYQAPKLGAENLPLMSRLHKRGRFFSGRKQWDETLIPDYWHDPELKDTFYPKEPPPMTPEQREAAFKEHDDLVEKYKHLTR